MGKITVLILDARPLFGQGLQALFAAAKSYSVRWRPGTAAEAAAAVRRECADVLLWGLPTSGADGFESIRRIRGRCPDVRLVVLSLQEGELAARSAFAAGADAYLSRSAGFGELCTAIDHVVKGKMYVSAETASEIFANHIHGRRREERASVHPALTPREREVLRLIAQGSSTREIAQKLGISTKTADTHRANLMRKLNIHNAPRLAAYAVRAGLA